MNALAILIPIALILGGIGLVAFFWSLKTGQFEDLEGAGMRILIDDEDALGGENGADTPLKAQNDTETSETTK
ncbi:MAG: cbb3-type cytochrome oxidase assembly protein CcoS [Rhodospirillales bacterium]|jgi:cbb3-type cytochrome oxidase maturation protein|nr:cbb3-type cytochrome oxidase assembly protein CcoS [Rhodospirillales bacterium]